MIQHPPNDTLPRAINDYVVKMGDRRQWEADQKLVEQYKQISKLENYVHYLEKQLDRIVTMNPELADETDKNEGA